MEIIYLGSCVGLVYTALGPKVKDGYISQFKKEEIILGDLFQILSSHSHKLHKTLHLPNLKHSLVFLPCGA